MARIQITQVRIAASASVTDAKISVGIDAPKAGVGFVLPNAGLRFVLPNAVTSFVNATASLAYVAVQITDAILNSAEGFTFLTFNDTVTITDVITLLNATATSAVDTTNTSDDHSFVVAKVFQDTINVTDVFNTSLASDITPVDTVTITDDFALEDDKIELDIFAVSDTVVIDVEDGSSAVVNTHTVNVFAVNR